MHNVVGPPVRGHDFFARDAEQRQMWRSLEDHHVLLLAPRRVGKTSLMYRLAEQAETRGFRAIYESAVKCETELALVSQLYKAVAAQDASIAAALTGGRLSRLVSRVKGVKGLGIEVELEKVTPDEWVTLQYGFNLGNVARERVIERTGWLIPHHLQLFVHQLREREVAPGVDIAPALVDAVFDDLARPSSRAYFDPWVQRLTEELGQPRDAQARDLLSAAARDPDGASREVLEQVLGRHIQEPATRGNDLTWLLSVLENDGYIVPAGGRYRFRSPLLRSYWLGRAP